MARTTAEHGTDVEVYGVSDEQVLEALRGGDVTLEIQDPASASLAMVERILASESAGDVLAKSDTTPAKELDGVPLEVSAVRWMGSKYRDADGEGAQGPAVFALIEAKRLDTGTAVLVTCGSLMVMAQLYKLRQIDALSSQPVKIVVKPATANGYRPMNLEPA
jgi:hypothetical protein